jgi:hypothetical protein
VSLVVASSIATLWLGVEVETLVRSSDTLLQRLAAVPGIRAEEEKTGSGTVRYIGFFTALGDVIDVDQDVGAQAKQIADWVIARAPANSCPPDPRQRPQSVGPRPRRK